MGIVAVTEACACNSSPSPNDRPTNGTNHPTPSISTDLKTKNAKRGPFSRSGAFPDQHLDHLQVAPLCCNHERCIALVFLAFDWSRAQSEPTLPMWPAKPLPNKVSPKPLSSWRLTSAPATKSFGQSGATELLCQGACNCFWTRVLVA